MADIFQIQAGTGNMGLFEIKGIKAVVAVHKRLSRGSRIPGISGIAVLQILVQLLFTDPQLLANLGGI